jgi:dihydroxy-acid dehydratase
MKSELITKDVLLAPQRGLLRAVGCIPEDFDKPFIGVINSWSEINPGHVHLRTLAEAAKQGIRAEGGVPFEMNTIGMCDGIAQGHEGMKRILPSRNLIADSIELAVDANRFDAIVLLASCDKIVPACWMAAARLDIPAIMVTGGPMMPGISGAGCAPQVREATGVSTTAKSQRRIWKKWNPASAPVPAPAP